MTPVDRAVRALVARHGALPFDEVMAAALYDPDGGFYTGGGRAGRRGDFVTSPEVGALFGAVVARTIDRWWQERGRPEVAVVVEVGAGPGTLARTVLAAAPACAEALRYVLVEVSEAQRALHGQHLTLEDPAVAFAAAPERDAPGPAPLPPGPIVVSTASMPRVPGPCFVLANELLDNLPFGIAERTADGWAEVLVAADGDGLVEVLGPLDDATASRLAGAAPDAEPGARLPIPRGADAWVADALEVAGSGGTVLAFDYARTAAELAAAPAEAWLRTYRQHQRGGSPLESLGTQDITADVPVDLLRTPPDVVRTQADWLRHHGIDELVASARATWHERAAIGDLAALRARSRVNEAEALLEPDGLGGFLALEWRP
ncbi:MAG TPA: SAM-dependent methyltransferase [Acidimicrobiales bacterium]|nr:SAM-dependent methyltransferase [Acidimicrobiales bacterium]